jgi:type II secretory pathway component GspD/PulD (secretin)
MKRGLLLAALGLVLFEAAGSVRAADPPPVTLTLRDAPLREALRQVFDATGVQFELDNDVQGFVTLTIRDQPFEAALKLLLRSSAQPLTYRLENGVYVVSVRKAVVPPPPATPAPEPTRSPGWEFLPLTYLDPLALEPLLGPIREIDHFRRWRPNGAPNGAGQGAPGNGTQNAPGGSGLIGSGGPSSSQRR